MQSATAPSQYKPTNISSMKRRLTSLLAGLLSAGAASGADLYVSPFGSSSNRGSESSPLDLDTALSSRSPARPGDTIWLRGGTYKGKFVSTISGSSGVPITVRSYPGEWAKIDSGIGANRAVILQINGSWTIFRDLEVMSSDTKRSTSYSGSFPDDIRRGEGIHINGANTKVINVVVHDAALGIAAWSSAPNSEIYGCIIYYNGWQAPDRAHGHGIYSQNASGQRLIRDNIIFSQFDKGIQVYGSEAASLRNHLIEGNVVFNSGIVSFNQNVSENLTLWGGDTGPEGIVIKENQFYSIGSEGKLVIGGEGAKDLVFQNNYVPLKAKIRYWQSAIVSGNTFAAPESVIECYLDSRFSSSNYSWDRNTYLCAEEQYSPFILYRLSSRGSLQPFLSSFNGWRSETRFDSSSSYSKGRPTSARVFVRPNRYDSNRANIAIYNWGRLSSVAADLSSVLSEGQSYRIYNAQDYFGAPVASGTFTGAPVSIPMSGLTIATPVGLRTPPNTAPEFGAFVLRAGDPPRSRPSNTSPTLSSIANQTVESNTSTLPIPFTVGDAETAPDKLSVLASSSNHSLVPNSNISLGGSGAQRTLSIEPAPNRTGSATITVAVTDGTLLTTKNFSLNVLSVDAPPEISPIADQIVHNGASTGPIPFTVRSARDGTALSISARASNATQVPSENIVVAGTGEARTISVRPAPNQFGSTTIFVVAVAGRSATQISFELFHRNSTAEAPVSAAAPEISTIRDQVTYNSTPTQAVEFTITDADTPAEDLLVSATASNPTQVPTLELGGSGTTRTLVLAPGEREYGSTTITVTVSDGIHSDSTEFEFYNKESSGNTAPIVSAIPDQSTRGSLATQPIAFAIADDHSEADNLRVWAEPSNPTQVPPSNIIFTGTGADRIVTITPAPGQYGTTTIYILVNDGELTTQTSFVLSALE